MLVSFLDREIQRLLRILSRVLERVIEQIDDMLVPQVLEEIVELSVPLWRGATADRRAIVVVPFPQNDVGVFTLDGLFESGRDFATPKTGTVTPDGKYDSSCASTKSATENTQSITAVTKNFRLIRDHSAACSFAMDDVVHVALWPAERGPPVGSTGADVYGD